MTEQQVLDIMGNPMVVSATPNGNSWAWSYADGFGNMRAMSVLFKDGKVASAPAVPATFR